MTAESDFEFAARTVADAIQANGGDATAFLGDPRIDGNFRVAVLAELAARQDDEDVSEAWSGRICVVCAMWEANGEDISDDDESFEPFDDYHVIVLDEAGFSSSPCDGCGSRLGGDRFEALFVPVCC